MPGSKLEAVINKCEASPIRKEDGFEKLLISDNLVLDGGDEDMLPVGSANNSTLSESPACLVRGMLPTESPMIISTLLSKRVLLSSNFDVSHELNLLNDDNGASPMFGQRDNQVITNITEPLNVGSANNQERRKLDFGSSVLTQSGANSNNGHGSGRVGGLFSSLRRCTSMIDQRHSPTTSSTANNFKPPDDFTSPISRSNSGGQSSGFKRPLAIRRPNSCSVSSSNELPFRDGDQDQDMNTEDATTGSSFLHSYHEQNLRNEGSSKRPRWDMSKGRPPLLKSHSMSSIGEESPSGNEETN